MKNKRYFDALRVHLESEEPNSKGEYYLFCPLHDDTKRSASINFDLGKWKCHGCGEGGSIKRLVEEMNGGPGRDPDFVPANLPFSEADVKPRRTKKTDELPTEGSIHGWHSALMSNREALATLQEARGLNVKTITDYQIGYESGQGVYTIPIRDYDGNLVNVRFYDMNPKDDRRKIWGVTGHNDVALYPAAQIDNDTLVICEGEWDALLTIQNGIPAITRTGSSDTWNRKWNERFREKKIYLCQDMDEAGQRGNAKIKSQLRKLARVKTISLPYPITEKHGKDLTDYWLEGHSVEDFKVLMKEAVNGTKEAPKTHEFTDLSILDSFSAAHVGRPLRMRATVTGKKSPTSLTPQHINYACSQDAGPKCAVCPMYDANGEMQRTIPPEDPITLEMMGSTIGQLEDLMRKAIGAQKCNRLTFDVDKHRAIEELTVRPSVEMSRIQSGEAGDYTTRRIISVGRYDTMANNTVELVGTVYPNPRSQHNEFQAWEVTKTETSVDRFEMTPEIRQRLTVFQPSKGQAPLKKLGHIAKDLSLHVTKIYGRTEMHVAMDLIWHSMLQFEFAGVIQQRGWLELLVIGDTRTGKSEAAQRLMEFYRMGEMLSCESSSFAGIMGGLQQMGGGKEWEVTWGAVPLNDRRLVALDEISGLSTEQISQMSSIRSSGEAQLTKIRSERTWARTRLIWLGNPRGGHRMADFTYGVQAIKPLIGNNEDIARFDLAMSVHADEVDPEVINRDHAAEEFTEPAYAQEECQWLVQWVWSRRAEHVLWENGAQDAVYAAALDMGKRYVETPPLVQSANVRIKIARVAAAIAARTFSTDKSGEMLIIRKVHVRDAVRLIDHLYGMPNFGYKDWSEEQLADIQQASEFYDDAKQYLANDPELSKFLRQVQGGFRTQDLQDMLNLDREMANAKINTLWKYRMIIRSNADIRMQPLMHEILRELKGK